MKLSEAIRLGAMLKPQGRLDYEKDGATCAIGAAMEATSILGTFQTDEMLCERWPILAEEVPAPKPITWSYPCSVLEIVFELNDSFNWTREAIADWVATIEAQHESRPEQQPVSVEV